MRHISICLAAFLVSVSFASVKGQAIPAGYTIPDITLSPDHRYGVTVPSMDADIAGTIQNEQSSLVEVKTGRVVGVIQADVAFDHMNHDNLDPAWWAADDSMMLWQVDGKWGYRTVNLINLEDGKIKSQVDVLNLLDQEILKRTLAAEPNKYAQVKSGSDGYGSWYRDGFAIDCVVDQKDGPMTFPLLFNVFLTSNVKGMDDVVNVDSRMTAEVSADGKVKVLEFHLGKTPPSRNWD